MTSADRIEHRASQPSRPGAIRPLVLLVLDDDAVRARFAYQLTASGFDVAVMDLVAGVQWTTTRPDLIVAALSARRSRKGSSIEVLGNDGGLRGVPVVAVADDASHATRVLARQEGCAAVCLSTCSGAALVAGIRAVLDRGDQ